MKWQRERVRNDARTYTFRNEVLKLHGFVSYSDYLRSDLWKSIKRRVLERKGSKCLLCGKRANEVHHHEYSEKALLGISLGPLWPICSDCHKAVEFTNCKKNDMMEARRIFREMHTAYCDRTGAFNVFSDEAQEIWRAHARKRCRCGSRPRMGSDLCRRCEAEVDGR